MGRVPGPLHQDTRILASVRACEVEGLAKARALPKTAGRTAHRHVVIAITPCKHMEYGGRLKQSRAPASAGAAGWCALFILLRHRMSMGLQEQSLFELGYAILPDSAGCHSGRHGWHAIAGMLRQHV